MVNLLVSAFQAEIFFYNSVFYHNPTSLSIRFSDCLQKQYRTDTFFAGGSLFFEKETACAIFFLFLSCGYFLPVRKSVFFLNRQEKIIRFFSSLQSRICKITFQKRNLLPATVFRSRRSLPRRRESSSQDAGRHFSDRSVRDEGFYPPGPYRTDRSHPQWSG